MTIEQAALTVSGRNELPQMCGLYPTDEVADAELLHVDDAFGWVVECFGRAYLIQRDAPTGRHTVGSFQSLDRIVRMFGRHEPLGVLRPDDPARWPARLITDAYEFGPDDGLLGSYRPHGAALGNGGADVRN